MKVKVCGVKYMEGTGKKSGKPYKAYSVHYTMDGSSQGYAGYVTGEAFVAVDLVPGRAPVVGDRIDLGFDQRGFLQSVEFLDD